MLTLDEPLQWETEQSLIDEVTATKAKGGMAVVVDTTNGDVLAMASIDGASGNAPPRPSGPTEATRPLMDLFEPGSTNKLITLSTAIQDGLVTPDTEIDVPSVLRVGQTRVHRRRPARRRADDRDRHPAAVVEHRHDQDRAAPLEGPARRRAALRSGLGRTTSVQFPGQAAGLLLDPSQYYDTGLASTAIGYGVAVTGMQMLDAYVTIANGGVTPPAAPARRDDRREGRPAPGDGRARVAASCRRTPRRRCRTCSTGVVSAGTGACAAIPGYTIAGKTGTARKAVDGGYSTGTMASFIGYAPAAHPKLAAIVVLDEPDEHLRR